MNELVSAVVHLRYPDGWVPEAQPPPVYRLKDGVHGFWDPEAHVTGDQVMDAALDEARSRALALNADHIPTAARLVATATAEVLSAVWVGSEY